MKAMILAVGLGQRMRPLTDHLPKPMLKLAGKPLIQYHLEALAEAGITEVIINLAYLGEKIQEFAGDGSTFGLNIIYSREPEPLETGGALYKALPLLGDDTFLLVNGDVWTDLPLKQLAQHKLAADVEAHLILVPNPDFHPKGDFSPNAQGRLVEDPMLPRFTFAGISILKPSLIATYPHKRAKFPLVEALRFGIANEKVTAEVYAGGWSDVGTPQRLEDLNKVLMQTYAQKL